MRSIEECGSALRELAAEDLTGHSDAALLDRARAWERLARLADAGRAAGVAAIHRRGAAAHDGSASTKAWLQGRFRLTQSQAGTLVNTAAALPDLPRFAAALAQGDTTLEHAAVAAWLARAVATRDPQLVPQAEEMLFPHAERLNCAELRQVAKHIKKHLIPEKDHPPEPERAVFLAQTFGDVWDLKGSLTPEFGAMLQAYLHAMPKPDPEDARSAAERRHDHLEDAIRQTLETLTHPEAAGERPHITVLVPAQDLHAGHSHGPDDPWEGLEDESHAAWDWEVGADWLTGTAPQPAGASAQHATTPSGTTGRHSPLRFGRIPHPGDGARTAFGDFLSDAALQRLACDATINRIVLDPDDVVLSAGRRVRLVTGAQRRALNIRDGRCRFHYCTRPAAWSQAHHVTPWTQGGQTNLDNLILLCGFHHHRVHDDGWTLAFDGRIVTIRRPDGTLLPPPPS